MIDLDELLRPLVEAAPPPPPIESLLRRARSLRHRRRAARTALLCVLVLGLTAGIIHLNGPAVSRVATVPLPVPQGATITAPQRVPIMPAGWQTISYGPIQFGVPALWPVYRDNRCLDGSTNAVFLGLTMMDNCHFTIAATFIQVEQYLGGGPAWAQPTMLNGLHAFVSRPNGTVSPGGGYRFDYFVFIPHQIVFQFWLGRPTDLPLADQIVSTISPATHPRPFPAEPPVPRPPTIGRQPSGRLSRR